MIMAHRSAVITLVIGSLMAAPLRAQSLEENWNNLNQLKTDQEIQIVTKDAKAHRGRLGGLNADSVTVHLVSGDQTFERLNILRVAYKAKGRRAHHIKVGSAIGAGLGVVNGVFSDTCRSCRSRGASIVLALFASVLLGAAIGAVLPAGGGWKVIYRSP
jgi:hypothetical protein